MGLLSGLLGHASETDVERLEKEFEKVLIEGERVDAAFKVIRDMYVFTDKRLILLDRQGLTGHKTAYVSIPYDDISHFSIETAGDFDIDAELKIWLRGKAEPIGQEFGRGDDVHRVHRTLAKHVLK